MGGRPRQGQGQVHGDADRLVSLTGRPLDGRPGRRRRARAVPPRPASPPLTCRLAELPAGQQLARLLARQAAPTGGDAGRGGPPPEDGGRASLDTPAAPA